MQAKKLPLKQEAQRQASSPTLLFTYFSCVISAMKGLTLVVAIVALSAYSAQATKKELPSFKVEKPEFQLTFVSQVENVTAEIEAVAAKLLKPELPEKKLPEIKPLAIEVKPIEIKKVELPKIEVPKLELPKFEKKEIELPKFEKKKIELPKFEKKKIELPKVDIKAVEVPPVTVPKFEKTKGKFEIPEFDVAAFNLTIAEVEQPAETAEKKEYSFKG